MITVSYCIYHSIITPKQRTQAIIFHNKSNFRLLLLLSTFQVICTGVITLISKNNGVFYSLAANNVHFHIIHVIPLLEKSFFIVKILTTGPTDRNAHEKLTE